MANPNSVYQAAHKGDFDLVKSEIDKDPTLLHKKDNDGRILLHWASISGNLKLVTCLIEANSEINTEDDTATTPIILAASSGRFDVVKLLIQYGADVNHKTDLGHSALQYAASKGHLNICICLVEANADINISDIRGATPLHRAASLGNTDIVKYLLSIDDKIEINQRDAYGNTPLHLACEEDRQAEAVLLAGLGAKTDILNKEKKTPLDLCSKGLRKVLAP